LASVFDIMPPLSGSSRRRLLVADSTAATPELQQPLRTALIS